MMLPKIVCSLGALFVATSALFSEETAASAISFVGPEVLKLDWSTRALNASDVNGDGLNDLVLVNNDTAQIEVLTQLGADDAGAAKKTRLNRNRWEPVLEDARFEREGITVGGSLFDLSVGDLNGDGRADLVYTSGEVPLTVRYQDESGDWAQAWEFDNFEAIGWTGGLKVADLDGDGRLELVVLAADAFRVFRQNESGEIVTPELYYVTGENPFNLMLEDVTGDGLLDVLYITSSGRQSLAFREQLGGGGFGPERRFVFERPVRLVNVLPRIGEEALVFCSVDSRSGGLEFFILEKSQHVEGEVGVFASAQPEIYPILKTGRAAVSYAWADFDDNGSGDLLAADPGSSELMLFLKAANRFQSPLRFPTFSAVSSMTGGRFFEGSRDALVVVSAEEQMLGVSRMDAAGRVSFPSQLILGEGEPLVCEAVDLDGDGYDELALVSKVSKKMELILARPVDRSDSDAGWEVLSRQELEGVKRKPSAIRMLDVFEDGQSGLMIFVAREAPVFLKVMDVETLELVAVASESTIRESLLKSVEPSQVSVFDVDGDGVNELVVGRVGYARSLRFRGEALELVDQFNAVGGDDVVSAIVPLSNAGKVDQLGLYIAASGELQILERQSNGVFSYHRTEDSGKIRLKDWLQLEGDSEAPEFVFLGEDRFWVLPSKAESWTRVVTLQFETDLEEVHYTHVAGADFDGNGQLDLLAVDGNSHVAEVLVQDGAEWKSELYWEIFEQNMHYLGRTGGSVEPRQILISDLTGDGHLDLVFLVHDRILFFPQE